MRFRAVFVVFLTSIAAAQNASGFEGWPPLPAADSEALIPAQEWKFSPEPREVTVYVRYPGGERENITDSTGLMLSLHNWGGTGFRGTADPAALIGEYDLVVIGVDYLQSGPYDAEQDPPYDFGYLQALDALRALAWVYDGLKDAGVPFDASRIYAAGGSGGGNVSLMANKLAPRTFACVVDLSGMAALNDDIAFGLPGGSHLNAGYSQDPADPDFLSEDERAIRMPGHPQHAATMKALGNEARIVVVHGVADKSCPVDDAREMAQNMEAASLHVAPHFIDEKDTGDSVFRNAGHSLGNRTEIVQYVAGKYLKPTSPTAARRSGAADFDARDEAVRYETPNGVFVISYTGGYPVGRFESADTQ